MNTIQAHTEFMIWLEGLADKVARTLIVNRVTRAREGNFGDAKALGGGLSEMRIDYGPGYRVYYTRVGAVVYLLLAGGDKSTQDRDIEVARARIPKPEQAKAKRKGKRK